MAKQSKEVKELYSLQQQMAKLAKRYHTIFVKMEEKAEKSKGIARELGQVGGLVFGFHSPSAPGKRVSMQISVGHEMYCDHLMKEIDEREKRSPVSIADLLG